MATLEEIRKATKFREEISQLEATKVTLQKEVDNKLLEFNKIEKLETTKLKLSAEIDSKTSELTELNEKIRRAELKKEELAEVENLEVNKQIVQRELDEKVGMLDEVNKLGATKLIIQKDITTKLKELDLLQKSIKQSKLLKEKLDKSAELKSIKLITQKELDDKLKEFDDLRKKLAILKSSKAEFIEVRKRDLEKRLARVDLEIEAKLEALTEINATMTSILSELDEKMVLAVNQIEVLTNKANKFVFRGNQFQELSEDLFKKVNERILYLDEFIKENSKKEKELNTKENEVDKKYKLATEKLQKAKDIMYWHKRPGKYQEE